jgi:ribose 5-phosphate isomerase B
MIIGIGNDHHGVKLKNKIVKYLTKKGHQIINYGSNDQQSVDYPDYAKLVGEAVSNKTIDLGILICGTGIGMSIACNKIDGARCAKITTIKEARLSREHNNANVVALNGDMYSFKAKDILDEFLNTNFSNDERHINRINKIEQNINNE